ncbi:glycine betaine/L-proline ABC transporter substrate-binding protein ProX [Limisalsivibrio acetivorans]|uniref:glycine betaine/L-proline ABC transporter substrate-binding protein ProX n=1 Tax=Limisalsivibrio acetivorans TaxID=1304888 RepID=UPI0003B3C467|nr:glycine betaine/L-proline ABC transporter substrate-binding protein ProX [Limisalsivibrio acetivorans]
MKALLRLAAVAVLAAALAIPAIADNHMKPGKGVDVNPARATWNTGFFQAKLVRMGLEELGFDVGRNKDLQNPIFYKTVTLGDVDYWPNGWFPIHNAQLPSNFYDHADTYGYVVKAGGLQGYLASKKYVEQYNIKSLEDFKRPEVKEAFDANGDGKADMVACPPGWGCEKVIAFHMDAYDLHDHVNLIKATYEASMADALARHQNDEPVLFYTWTPNWTVFKFKPGEDVLWINVPEIVPTDAQKGSEDKMVASGVKGTVTDPLKFGFIASDIRIVANKEFAEKNPAAKVFFENFKLTLTDIAAQNTKMNNGEKSEADIERHAKEWIKANQDMWDSWLDKARAAAE